MKERPILFSGDMVRAILAGRKMQTRRVIDLRHVHDIDDAGTPMRKNRNGIWGKAPCPYGQVGDRLWVREKWKIGAWREDGRIAIDYAASPEITNTPWTRITDDIDGEKFNSLTFALSEALERKGVQSDEYGYYHWEAGESPLNWRPSIHMPRWASRITLEVTEVRVQRLQEITDEDAIAEGVEPVGREPYGNVLYRDYYLDDYAWSAKESFISLWHTLHGFKGPNAWSFNPWVWAVSFKVVTP